MVDNILYKSIGNVFAEFLDLVSDSLVTVTEKELLIARSKYSEYVTEKIGTFPVFATSFNSRIEDIFTEVVISRDIERERYRSVQQIEAILRKSSRATDNEEVSSGLKPLAAIDAGEGGFALIGGPGAGKTTIFRYLALRAAAGRKIRGRKRLPVFIQLRDIREGKTLAEAVYEYLNDFSLENPVKVVKSLLDQGRVLILIDGLDEVAIEQQRDVIRNLENLKFKYDKVVFCVSSRPYSLGVGLSGFTKWEVQPMSLPAQLEFVKKWFHHSQERGNSLIRLATSFPRTLELGDTPLFLSILCALYYHDLQLPSNEVELYDRCIEGLIGQWDAFRNMMRTSALANYSYSQRRSILTHVAAYTFSKKYLVFKPSDLDSTGCLIKLSEIIRKEIPDSDSLLISLYNDFGILVERAPGMYSFTHLTLQEYLTAKYIVDSRTELQIADRLMQKDEYSNVLRYVVKMLSNSDDFVTRCLQYYKTFERRGLMSILVIVEADPICGRETYVKLVRKLMQVLRTMVKRSERYAKYALVGDTIEVRLNYAEAGPRVAEAVDLIRYGRQPDKDLQYVRQITGKSSRRKVDKMKALIRKEKERNDYNAAVIIAITNLKRIVNALLVSGSARQLLKDSDHPDFIKLFLSDIKSINVVNYLST